MNYNIEFLDTIQISGEICERYTVTLNGETTIITLDSKEEFERQKKLHSF